MVKQTAGHDMLGQCTFWGGMVQGWEIVFETPLHSDH